MLLPKNIVKGEIFYFVSAYDVFLLIRNKHNAYKVHVMLLVSVESHRMCKLSVIKFVCLNE